MPGKPPSGILGWGDKPGIKLSLSRMILAATLLSMLLFIVILLFRPSPSVPTLVEETGIKRLTIKERGLSKSNFHTICIEGIVYLMFRSGYRDGMMTVKYRSNGTLELCDED